MLLHSAHPIQAGEQVASLPLDSLYTAALNVWLMLQLGGQKMLTSNYTTANVANIMSEFLPSSPSLGLGMLVLTGFGQPKLMAQFDGSAHRSRHIGGAGAALFQVDSTGMPLLDWGSQALPKCIDRLKARVPAWQLLYMNGMWNTVSNIKFFPFLWTQYKATLSLSYNILTFDLDSDGLIW